MEWRSRAFARIMPLCDHVSPSLGRHKIKLCGVNPNNLTTYIYSKTCLKRPFKKKTKVDFKTDYRLMQVESIAECSKRAFCNTFDLH